MSSSDSKLDLFKDVKQSQIRIGIPTLVFDSWPKITLMKVLCGKKHCCDGKSTCPARDIGLL
jgi:hypothetical protein